jgi:hypothetical protein
LGLSVPGTGSGGVSSNQKIWWNLCRAIADTQGWFFAVNYGRWKSKDPTERRGGHRVLFSAKQVRKNLQRKQDYFSVHAESL